MIKRNVAVALIALLLAANVSRAELVKKQIDYKQGDATLKGYLVYDDAKTGKRPGVVVVPEWWGLTDYPRHRADMLAELGYVAFAADIYGNGETTTDPKRAGELAGKFRGDRELLRTRVQAAVDELKKQEQADSDKLAAIGYCFGGTAVLEAARTGAPLKGVVSFHGGLDFPQPPHEGQIKAKVLVLTGDADPMVPPEQVKKFEQEMKNVGADVKIERYPDAVHAFTNPNADKVGIKGIGYNKEADEKSWQAMKQFFEQNLK
ncbi:MAG TPA: dienelactone hydrolase family protein [Tepidisphaeraceae bacterium]|jgi:dienelactone hydrolase